MGILKQQFKQGWCESVFAGICVQPFADKCEFVIYITISKKKKITVCRLASKATLTVSHR